MIDPDGLREHVAHALRDTASSHPRPRPAADEGLPPRDGQPAPPPATDRHAHFPEHTPARPPPAADAAFRPPEGWCALSSGTATPFPADLASGAATPMTIKTGGTSTPLMLHAAPGSKAGSTSGWSTPNPHASGGSSPPSKSAWTSAAPIIPEANAKATTGGNPPSSSSPSDTRSTTPSPPESGDDVAGPQRQQGGDAGSHTSLQHGADAEAKQRPPSPEWKIVTWNVYGDQDLERSAGSLDPMDDPANPKTWPLWRRSFILATVVSCSVCGTTCSSMAASGSAYIQRDFQVGHEVAALSVSLFVLALGLGPAVIGPLSEFYGRRLIYIVFFGFFILLNFPVAFANNPAVFFIFRFFTGLCTSAFLSVAGGSVHDMFLPAQSFEPMSFFSASPFLGPGIGPLIMGFVDYFTDNFRWSFYVIIIWATVLWLLNLFFCPETLASVILTRRAKKLREQTRDPRWVSQAELDRGDRTQLQTIQMFLRRVPQLLSEPMMICLCIWSSFLLGLVYLFFQAVPFVLKLHDFNLWQCGLGYLGLIIGMLLSIASVPFWRKKYDQAVEKAGGKAAPEARLPMAMTGAIFTAIGLYLFGLTSFKHHVHWIGPIISLAPFGFGVVLVFISIFTFTGECWRTMAASALAVNALCRCTSAAAFPLFSVQMYNGMTAVGASLFLAGLNTLMIPIPFVFYKYGPAIRAKSKYASS